MSRRQRTESDGKQDKQAPAVAVAATSKASSAAAATHMTLGKQRVRTTTVAVSASSGTVSAPSLAPIVNRVNAQDRLSRMAESMWDIIACYSQLRTLAACIHTCKHLHQSIHTLLHKPRALAFTVDTKEAYLARQMLNSSKFGVAPINLLANALPKRFQLVANTVLPTVIVSTHRHYLPVHELMSYAVPCVSALGPQARDLVFTQILQINQHDKRDQTLAALKAVIDALLSCAKLQRLVLDLDIEDAEGRSIWRRINWQGSLYFRQLLHPRVFLVDYDLALSGTPIMERLSEYDLHHAIETLSPSTPLKPWPWPNLTELQVPQLFPDLLLMLAKHCPRMQILRANELQLLEKGQPTLARGRSYSDRLVDSFEAFATACRKTLTTLAFNLWVTQFTDIVLHQAKVWDAELGRPPVQLIPAYLDELRHGTLAAANLVELVSPEALTKRVQMFQIMQATTMHILQSVATLTRLEVLEMYMILDTAQCTDLYTATLGHVTPRRDEPNAWQLMRNNVLSTCAYRVYGDELLVRMQEIAKNLHHLRVLGVTFPADAKQCTQLFETFAGNNRQTLTTLLKMQTPPLHVGYSKYSVQRLQIKHTWTSTLAELIKTHFPPSESADRKGSKTSLHVLTYASSVPGVVSSCERFYEEGLLQTWPFRTSIPIEPWFRHRYVEQERGGYTDDSASVFADPVTWEQVYEKRKTNALIHL